MQARHYDWKLRAIKTTLYVAGGMKRDAPDLTEDKARPINTYCTSVCLVSVETNQVRAASSHHHMLQFLTSYA